MSLASKLALPMRSPWLRKTAKSWWEQVRDYFSVRPATFLAAFWPMVLLSTLLYIRYLPTTNYIFDEQEALLGNPYLNQPTYEYGDAIYRDFWGLPANASIGSYRPVPNLLWRGLIEFGERGQNLIDTRVPESWKIKYAGIHESMNPGRPVETLTELMKKSWPQHLFNLLFHGVNGAIFVAMAYRLSKRHLLSWVAGTTFVTAAILTEAVSGVVGIADVLGGLGALLALAALAMRAHAMPFAVFLATLLGLFSKESAIVCLPLTPVAALLFSHLLHPERPARLARAGLALVGSAVAFIVYVELRKRWFPSSLPAELAEGLEPGASTASRWVREFMIWFHQAPLPKDPLNNPLVDAPTDLRVAGACRVYFRGLTQVVFPWSLSGDYSFPQEPAPKELIFPESVLGWFFLVGSLGIALGLYLVALRRETKQREALALGADPATEHPMLAALAKWLTREGHHAAIDKRAQKIGVWERRLFEGAVILFSVWLGYKLNLLGPSEMNKDFGDKELDKHIAFSKAAVDDLMVYAGCACLFVGGMIEGGWKRRTVGVSDYRLPVIAMGLVWLVVSYFPHSNIAVLLPTVRAERLWYFPVLGTTMVIAVLLTMGFDKVKLHKRWGTYAFLIPTLFLGFQGVRAYIQSMAYRDDLVFWRSTKEAVPNSAKAHLNYSVMLGARGYMDQRLEESFIALELAPDWAMAHVYTGDTLCRMGRVEESWPYYRDGFEKGPNDKSLIVLGLQCLFDTKNLKLHEEELRKMAVDHPGSWIAYLAVDTLDNGDKQGGVIRDKPAGQAETQTQEAATETVQETTIELTVTESAGSAVPAESAQ